MARHLSGHSRLVFWLKITLPILGLAILSSLFLFARRIDFEGSLPYAEVADLANDPRLSAPRYSAVTRDGAAVRVAATTARPGAAEGDPMTAEDVVAVYAMPSGSTVTVRAKSGALDMAANLLSLTGDVSVATSDGYELLAPAMTSSLAESDLSADGGVSGKAPFGTVSAAELRMSGPEGAQDVVFKGQVRLIYQP